jgi:ATP-dependent Clp protease ATP-binding subunit ClpC
VFERFTDRARRVVVFAQEEARLLNHNYIGTEHVLLGLVREGEGVAARALTSMGIGLDAVRGQVEKIIGQGQAAPAGHIPFTPRAKKVLELSLREALQLGHNYIGTEHILLGLLREGEGVAAQVLQQLGADLNRVRQTVIQLLSGYSQGKERGPSAALHEEVQGEGGLPGPRCPRCNADLAVFATYRTITLPDEEESAGRQVAFVFCRSCSYTVGMLPE